MINIDKGFKTLDWLKNDYYLHFERKQCADIMRAVYAVSAQAREAENKPLLVGEQVNKFK